MTYGFVEDGIIKEGPKSLPAAWRNVSGLNLLSQEELRSLGWLPWRVVEVPGDILTGSTIDIQPTEIVETQTRRNKTEQEIADEQQAQFDRQSSEVRDDRNRRLAACDWTQLSDAPVDNLAWATYRQALRDVPSQSGFPWNVVWPIEP